MIWKEFKKEIEALGVKDTDQIAYIDVNFLSEIKAEKRDDEWAIH